jgi:hypothetical protein
MAGLRLHVGALAALAVLGLAAAAPAAAATAPWVTTQGNRFVRTGTGATVVLRGVNVAAGPNLSLQDRAVQLGANLVRIHVTWADLQPQPPTPGDPGWNTALIARLQTQVAWYRAHSINVLIDLHQYHWSSFFGPRGAGIPAWFYTHVHPDEFPPTHHGMIKAFEAFYTDPQAVTLYTALAREVATSFAGDANVVGYEVLNEPLAGGSQAAVDRVLRFEATIRQAFAAVDPQRTVFVMARTGGDLGLLDASFKPFGGLGHLALDYHAYFSGRRGTGLTFDGLTWAPTWNATHMQVVHAYRGTEAAQLAVLLTPIRKANDLRIPLLVGEWGDLRGTTGGSAYQAQMLAVFRRYGLSWARWALSPHDVFGLLDPQSQPTAAFAQLERALRVASPPPPPPGPHLPAFAVSRPRLSLGNADAHPLLLCTRPAASSTRTTISLRDAAGRLIRHIQLGAVASGRVACRRWRGGDGRGGDVHPGTVFLRVGVRYAAGRRFSVWRTVSLRP